MIKIIKQILFAMCLLPLLRLVVLAMTDGLGANPVEFIIRSLGTWTLVMLMATLAVTPVNILTGVNRVVQFRRMLGLFTFFYACLHFFSYAGLDLWFEWAAISKDITKHPYVLIGFSAFLMLIPLAMTSNKRMIMKLGRRWKTLHRSVYLIAILGVVHYWWLVKKDITEPAIYGAVLLLLFTIRLLNSPHRKAGTLAVSGVRPTNLIELPP